MRQGAIIYKVLCILVSTFLHPFKTPIILMNLVKRLDIGADILCIKVSDIVLTWP